VTDGTGEDRGETVRRRKTDRQKDGGIGTIKRTKPASIKTREKTGPASSLSITFTVST